MAGDFWSSYAQTAQLDLSGVGEAMDRYSNIAARNMQAQLAKQQMENAKMQAEQRRDFMSYMKQAVDDEIVTLDEVALAQARAGMDPSDVLKAKVQAGHEAERIGIAKSDLSLRGELGRGNLARSWAGLGESKRQFDIGQRMDEERLRLTAAGQNLGVLERASLSADPEGYLQAAGEVGARVPATVPRKRGDEWISDTGVTFREDPKTGRLASPDTGETFNENIHGSVYNKATVTKFGRGTKKQQKEASYGNFNRDYIEPAVKGYTNSTTGFGILTPSSNPEQAKLIGDRTIMLASTLAKDYPELDVRHVDAAIEDFYQRVTADNSAYAPLDPKTKEDLAKAGVQANTVLDVLKAKARLEWQRSREQELLGKQLMDQRQGVTINVGPGASDEDIDRMIEELKSKKKKR